MTSEMKGPLSDRIDRLCDQLESDLKSGKPTRIEELIRDSSGDERVELLRHLLAVEIDFRRARHDDFTVAEFVERFPEESALIHEVFDSPLPAEESVKTVSGGTDPAIQETIDVSMASTDETVVPLPSATDSFPGALGRFGDYELLQEIARGGMGVVYKARQVSLNRIIALKMIKSGELAGDEEIRRFRAEAEAAAKLDHPNIVPIHEVGEENGQQFFSMGFVEGKGLDARLKEGPLPPREAAELIRTIAEAIQYAHDKGIVHRDLKPANVLIDLDGKPRITDFGLAKNIAADSGMTATGQIMGTPSYMPPEQASGNTEEIGPLADVYSLGAMFYALLTGRPPFHAAKVMETLKQVCEQEPVSPRVLNLAVDRDLETICLKCLEKDTHHRYQSATHIVDDLERYLNREPISARPISRFESGWRWCRRNPTRAGLTVAIGTALLSLVAASVALTYQNELQGANDQLETANHSLESINGQVENANLKLNAALNVAKSAQIEAERARDAEARARDELDRVLTIRRVNLALAEWKNNESASARKLLSECPVEHRQWEWHYVFHQCHPEGVRFDGDLDHVERLAYSRDGKQLVSTGGRYDKKRNQWIGEVYVWNSETGKVSSQLKGHNKGIVNVAAFSNDGTRIVTGGDGRSLIIWDETLKKLRSIETDLGVIACRFSQDNRHLYVVTLFNLETWDIETGHRLRQSRLSRRDLLRAAIAVNRKLVVTGDRTGTITIFDLESGQAKQKIRAHSKPVWSVAISHDEQVIATGSSDGTVRIWNSETMKKEQSLETGPGTIYAIAFSKDGRYLAAGGGQKVVYVWDVKTGKLINRLQGHSDRVGSVVLSPDGKRIATGAKDVRVWNLQPREKSIGLPGLHGIESLVSVSPDGRLAIVGKRRENLTGEPDPRSEPDPMLTTVDTTNGRTLYRVKTHQSGVTVVSFSPDGIFFVTGSAERDGRAEIKVWNSADGKLIRTIKGHTKSIVRLVISRDGKRIASAGTDNLVKIWEVKSGREIATLRGHSAPIFGVAFSGDGSLVSSCGLDGTVRVWDPATGRSQMILKHQGDVVFHVAFLPANKRLVSAGRDGMILWDLHSRKAIWKSLSRVAGAITLDLLPDGSRIVTTDVDNRVRLWDTGSGRETLKLQGHTNTVVSVTALKDGRQIMSVGLDGTLKLWDARSGEWPVAPNLNAK